MAYGYQSKKRAKLPNYSAARAAHLRALEWKRKESAREIIAASKKAEEIFQAEKKAAALATSSPSSIIGQRLSKKERRAVAAAAARQERRNKLRVAQAKAEAQAEVTSLLANNAIRLAREMFALRLGDPKLREEDWDGGEEYEMEGWGEFKARVLSWHGIRRKDD
ncbi:hypothetical protein NHQ30_004253 [Ciborinia camelliae]|nr:hypothetical protein NHQ30_004253 [Ciborinia camelliae]